MGIGSPGSAFCRRGDRFYEQIKEIGALAANEASVENRLDIKLKAAISLVPYVRLVERERLRVHFNTREEYDAYFDSAEVERMFKELVIDKLDSERDISLAAGKSLFKRGVSPNNRHYPGGNCQAHKSGNNERNG